jgi:hypothetical protein
MTEVSDTFGSGAFLCLRVRLKIIIFLQTVGCGGFLLGRPPFPQCALSIARQAAFCNLDSHASHQVCGVGNISYGSGSTEAEIRIPAPDSFIRYCTLKITFFYLKVPKCEILISWIPMIFFKS